MKEHKPKQAKPERERKYTFAVIQQKYNGYNFRSRLEARWAVFFDGLSIPYVYEPEGVCLWQGGVYLPDFYLPKHHGGVYAEVKPDDFTEEELKKCRMLCRMSKRTVILLDGTPEPWWYNSYHCVDGHAISSTIILGAPCTERENRFYTGVGFADRKEAETMFTEAAQKALFLSRSAF
jgi:hypothetical protein